MSAEKQHPFGPLAAPVALAAAVALAAVALAAVAVALAAVALAVVVVSVGVVGNTGNRKVDPKGYFGSLTYEMAQWVKVVPPVTHVLFETNIHS